MAFSAIELTTITRSQDYTTIKQNEDYKGMVDQNNIGQQVQKQTQQLTREVHDSDNAAWYKKQPDAKEKGGNGYAGDGGRNREKKGKQENQEKHEQVLVKGRQSFDIKI